MLIQMAQLVCLYLACRVEILDTHILTNTHTTNAIPSIRLWADTMDKAYNVG